MTPPARARARRQRDEQAEILAPGPQAGPLWDEVWRAGVALRAADVTWTPEGVGVADYILGRPLEAARQTYLEGLARPAHSPADERRQAKPLPIPWGALPRGTSGANPPDTPSA